jgi:hypothetical protein
MTVKTKGAMGLSDCVIPSVKCVVPWRAVAGWLRLSTFANVEASNIDKIGNSATASVIRSAKARMGVFFFIFVLLGLICFLGESGEWSGLFKKRAEKRQVFCLCHFLRLMYFTGQANSHLLLREKQTKVLEKDS